MQRLPDLEHLQAAERGRSGRMTLARFRAEKANHGALHRRPPIPHRAGSSTVYWMRIRSANDGIESIHAPGAEIEFNVVQSQCLDRRIPDKETLP